MTLRDVCKIMKSVKWNQGCGAWNQNLTLTQRMISVWKIMTANWMCFNLFIWVNYQRWLVLVAVSRAWLEAGRTPSRKVYLLRDLIGQLAWVRRRDSEGHSYETRHVRTKTKGGQAEGRDYWKDEQQTHAHTDKYTTESSGQLFASCASPCERGDLQTAAWLSHFGVFVWRAARRRYRAVCLMFFSGLSRKHFCLCQPGGTALPAL